MSSVGTAPLSALGLNTITLIPLAPAFDHFSATMRVSTSPSAFDHLALAAPARASFVILILRTKRLGLEVGVIHWVGAALADGQEIATSLFLATHITTPIVSLRVASALSWERPRVTRSQRRHRQNWSWPTTWSHRQLSNVLLVEIANVTLPIHILYIRHVGVSHRFLRLLHRPLLSHPLCNPSLFVRQRPLHMSLFLTISVVLSTPLCFSKEQRVRRPVFHLSSATAERVHRSTSPPCRRRHPPCRRSPLTARG